MDNYCKYIYYGAAQSGNLSLFKSMKSQGYPFGRKACTIAAENGHLNIIKWILSQIKVWKEFNKNAYEQWLDNIICAAASRGHLHILEMVPEDITSQPVTEAALQNGQMTVLKWLQENDFLEVDGNSIVFAVKSGNLEVLEWIRNVFKSIWNWENATHKAVEIGNLDILKYLAKNCIVLSSYCCALAAANGHFEILKWMHENQCEWNSETTSNAASYGNLSILQWLIEKKCPVNPEKMATCAISRGNLQLIEWLASKFTIDWKNASFSTIAISNSHWDILEWLLAKKCHVDSIILAIRNGARLDILKKLFYVEPNTDWDKLCETAGSYGRFDFIEWVSHQIDCSIAWNMSYNGAMIKNQLDFMKKAYSNYCVCVDTLGPGVSTSPLYTWLKKCVE